MNAIPSLVIQKYQVYMREWYQQLRLVSTSINTVSLPQLCDNGERENGTNTRTNSLDIFQSYLDFHTKQKIIKLRFLGQPITLLTIPEFKIFPTTCLITLEI